MKRIFVDCETTGTDPKKHGLVQVSALIEIDGVIEDQLDFLMSPHDGAIIEDSALTVIGATRNDIARRPDATVVHVEFTRRLKQYVSPYDKTDKLLWVGYNAQFDVSFMREWFARCGDNYFGSYFWWPPVDVMNLAAFVLQQERATLANFKQGTVAQHLGIEVKADALHDGLYDVKLCRQILEVLESRQSQTYQPGITEQQLARMDRPEQRNEDSAR